MDRSSSIQSSAKGVLEDERSYSLAKVNRIVSNNPICENAMHVSTSNSITDHVGEQHNLNISNSLNKSRKNTNMNYPVIEKNSLDDWLVSYVVKVLYESQRENYDRILGMNIYNDNLQDSNTVDFSLKSKNCEQNEETKILSEPDLPVERSSLTSIYNLGPVVRIKMDGSVFLTCISDAQKQVLERSQQYCCPNVSEIFDCLKVSSASKKVTNQILVIVNALNDISSSLNFAYVGDICDPRYFSTTKAILTSQIKVPSLLSDENSEKNVELSSSKEKDFHCQISTILEDTENQHRQYTVGKLFVQNPQCPLSVDDSAYGSFCSTSKTDRECGINNSHVCNRRLNRSLVDSALSSPGLSKSVQTPFAQTFDSQMKIEGFSHGEFKCLVSNEGSLAVPPTCTSDGSQSICGKTIDRIDYQLQDVGSSSSVEDAVIFFSSGNTFKRKSLLYVATDLPDHCFSETFPRKSDTMSNEHLYLHAPTCSDMFCWSSCCNHSVYSRHDGILLNGIGLHTIHTVKQSDRGSCGLATKATNSFDIFYNRDANTFWRSSHEILEMVGLTEQPTYFEIYPLSSRFKEPWSCRYANLFYRNIYREPRNGCKLWRSLDFGCLSERPCDIMQRAMLTHLGFDVCAWKAMGHLMLLPNWTMHHRQCYSVCNAFKTDLQPCMFRDGKETPPVMPSRTYPNILTRLKWYSTTFDSYLPIVKNIGEKTGLPLDRYTVTHHPRGVAVILNASTHRSGSSRDRDTFLSLMMRMGFEVHVYDDPTKKDIDKVVEYYAEYDHKKCDMFAMCIAMHGFQGHVEDSVGQRVHIIDALIKPMHGCHSLRDKPKLFIIQACQEREHKEWKRHHHNNDNTYSDTSLDKRRYPDVIICFAANSGNAWRHIKYGSLYPHILYRNMLHHSAQFDIESIIENAVQIEAEKVTTELGLDLQIPFHLSTLRKRLYLPTTFALNNTVCRQRIVDNIVFKIYKQGMVCT